MRSMELATDDNLPNLARSMELLRSEVQTLGGSLVVENAPFQIKERLDSWGTFGATGSPMSRVKQQLDPHGVLSPGRFRFEMQ